MSTTFAEHLRRTREQRKMSQKELAVATGLSPQYINDVERGRRNPVGESAAFAIADALRIPADLVMIWSGKLPPDFRNLDEVEAIALQTILDSCRGTVVKYPP